jgi:hypothetical protein
MKYIKLENVKCSILISKQSYSFLTNILPIYKKEILMVNVFTRFNLIISSTNQFFSLFF